MKRKDLQGNELHDPAGDLRDGIVTLDFNYLNEINEEFYTMSLLNHFTEEEKEIIEKEIMIDVRAQASRMNMKNFDVLVGKGAPAEDDDISYQKTFTETVLVKKPMQMKKQEEIIENFRCYIKVVANGKTIKQFFDYVIFESHREE